MIFPCLKFSEVYKTLFAKRGHYIMKHFNFLCFCFFLISKHKTTMSYELYFLVYKLTGVSGSVTRFNDELTKKKAALIIQFVLSLLRLFVKLRWQEQVQKCIVPRWLMFSSEKVIYKSSYYRIQSGSCHSSLPLKEESLLKHFFLKIYQRYSQF